MKIAIWQFNIEITEEDVKSFVDTFKEIWIRLFLPKNEKDKIGLAKIYIKNIDEY